MMEGHSLKCSVCLELYNDPRVLPCLHTFCLKCITGFSNKNSSLTCPECRAKHEPLPVSGTNYPVNLSILSELEEAKSGDESSRICGFCIAGDVAVGFCEDCGEYLCQYCCDFHKKGKAFLSHNISAIDDINSTLDSIVPFSKQPANVSCVRHPKYELEIYCRDCSCLVCYKCMFEPSHKGHDYGSINDVSQEIEQDIESLSETASSKEIQFEACLALIEKIERVVISEQDKVRQKVKSIFDNLMTLLEEVFTEDNKTIWAVKNDFQMALPQIKSSHSLSTHAQRQIGQNIQSRSLVNQLLQCLMKIKNVDIPGAMEDVFHVRSSSNSFQKELFELLNFDNLLRHLLASRYENEDDIIAGGKCFWHVSDEESEPDWDEIELIMGKNQSGDKVAKEEEKEEVTHESIPNNEPIEYELYKDEPMIEEYEAEPIEDELYQDEPYQYNYTQPLLIPLPSLHLYSDPCQYNEDDNCEDEVIEIHEALNAGSCTVPFSPRVRAIAVIEQPFAKLTQWSVQCVSHEDQTVSVVPFTSDKIAIKFCPHFKGKYTLHLSPVDTKYVIELKVELY
uniref:RING-type domain-containing protein n=1 Tax=Amphimedon queenslandica TaxID=400682 RepID=A0A1X7SRN7_AMPQE